jgi:predicted transcriptional regulator
MTIGELIKITDLEVVNVADAERKIEGCYVGDLLSFVVSRVKANNAFVTIMNNVTTIAVATYANVTCVIMTETENVSDEVTKRANEHNVNLLKTKRTSYEICSLLAKNGIF